MITLIHGDAFDIEIPPVDMIFTDPPFEMDGAELLRLFERIDAQHLVLICTMRQALAFGAGSGWEFAFDLVCSHIQPRKSKSYAQPHMTHSNILYLRRPGVKSAFDRRRVQRSDYYADEAKHYYPSVFIAPKSDRVYKYQKNQQMINDILGALDVQSVCDPFAGSGTTGFAALEHAKDAILIERDEQVFDLLKSQFALLGAVVVRE